MQKIMIEEAFILYHLPSNNPENLGHNVYILLDGKRAMAIDTGYHQHFKEVLADLEAEGIEVVKVLPSHFHRDNVDGIFQLKRPKIYGNDHAKKTLENIYDQEDVAELMPNKLLSNKSVIRFGGFTLKVFHAPGHSNCGMLININDKYLHLGGLYMTTDQGEQVLPHVQWAGIGPHIQSLKIIRKSSCSLYLLSHGVSPLAKEEVMAGVDDRISYLHAIKTTGNRITLEEALKDTKEPFVFLKWHKEIDK